MKLKCIVLAALLLALSGCSVRQLALDNIGDALAQGGGAFSSDDDPELIRAAAPFSLKLIEPSWFDWDAVGFAEHPRALLG